MIIKGDFMLQLLFLYPSLFILLSNFETVDHLLYGDNSEVTLTFSPVDKIYRPYKADPRYPRNIAKILEYTSSNIDNVKSTRYEIGLGGMFSVARYHSVSNSKKAVQLDIGASIYSEYDVYNSLDNIGWDGVIATNLSFYIDKGLYGKLGVLHISSHLGDEYIQETGRERIHYTRNEYNAGISLEKDMRYYLEIGYGYGKNAASLESEWRFQIGADYEFNYVLFKYYRPFFALDAQSYEEDRYRLSNSIQLGMLTKKEKQGREFRVALEYYNGKAKVREFFPKKEESVGIVASFEM